MIASHQNGVSHGAQVFIERKTKFYDQVIKLMSSSWFGTTFLYNMENRVFPWIP